MAEPISLTIGVIPIVAGIIRQYSSTHEFCQRIRRHKAEIDELWRFLRRQRFIFNNETRFLLASAVGTDKALLMSKDIEDQGWKECQFGQQLNNVLGDMKDELEDAANEVSEQMKKLRAELESEGTLAGRIKFGASQTKLDSICRSIRDATKDYRTIVQQIRGFASQKSVVDCRSEVKCDLPRTQAIRTAAKHVYEALTAACKLHTNHHAQLSLKPVYIATNINAAIKFQLAYRHLSKGQATKEYDVLWFVVESIIQGAMFNVPVHIPLPATSIADMYGVKGGLKRTANPASSDSSDRLNSKFKKVRFRSQSPPSQDTDNAEPKRSVPKVEHSDFCSSADLCQKLLSAHQKNHDRDACIGFLEDSGAWEHRVYRGEHPLPVRASICAPDTRVLADLLRERGRSGQLGYSMSARQRLLIARSLATAMIDYHSTPWMQKSWRSSDIFLYNIGGIRSPIDTKAEPELFVEVLVKENNCLLNTATQPSFDNPQVRNSILFSLGVMMIELGFEKPFDDMLKPCDSKHAPISTSERDWNAAVRLSKEIGTSMGVTFSRVVDQCLFCAFGHGTNLENPALQEAVYRDVVTELDVMIEGFSRL